MFGKAEPKGHKEMPIELMSYDELIELKIRVDHEVASRGTGELVHLKDKLTAIANAQGISLIDLFGSGKPGKKERKKRDVKPKFRDPDTGEEWSGLGKPRRWLQEKLDAGHSLDEFRIQQNGVGVPTA